MTTNKQNTVSKEIEDFTTELFDYIWTKHKFVTSFLDKEFREKCSLIFKKSRKKSNFEDCIGNAVLCSQYLLREYCNYMFKSYGADLLEYLFFRIGVLEVIYFWTKTRKNVFVKMIDSAAISVEAVLFCEAELKVPVDEDIASSMFKSFFATLLQTEFFAKGGWSALRAKAIQDYHSLHLDLQRFIRCKNDPYGKLDHSCHLIKQLRKSPVQFPIPVSMFCGNCREPSEKIRVEFGNEEKLFYEIFKKALIRTCISNDLESLQNMDKLKNFLKIAYKDELARPDIKNVLKVLRKDEAFQAILIGKEEQEKKGQRKETKFKKPTIRGRKTK